MHALYSTHSNSAKPSQFKKSSYRRKKLSNSLPNYGRNINNVTDRPYDTVDLHKYILTTKFTPPHPQPPKTTHKLYICLDYRKQIPRHLFY